LGVDRDELREAARSGAAVRQLWRRARAPHGAPTPSRQVRWCAAVVADRFASSC